MQLKIIIFWPLTSISSFHYKSQTFSIHHNRNSKNTTTQTYKQPLRVTKFQSPRNKRIRITRYCTNSALSKKGRHFFVLSLFVVVAFNALRHQEVTVRQRPSMQHSNPRHLPCRTQSQSATAWGQLAWGSSTDSRLEEEGKKRALALAQMEADSLWLLEIHTACTQPEMGRKEKKRQVWYFSSHLFEDYVLHHIRTSLKRQLSSTS